MRVSLLAMFLATVAGFAVHAYLDKYGILGAAILIVAQTLFWLGPYFGAREEDQLSIYPE